MTNVRSIFAHILAGSVLIAGLASCATSGSASENPDDRFGHRVDGSSDDGRDTIVIQPPDADRTYGYFPAAVQSINVRSEPVDAQSATGGISVEILVKGAFPDACSELHDVAQERSGNVVRVTLRMRRPAGAVCASVLRPYRFYLELEGGYAVGAYSLLLNNRSYPFEIRPPSPGTP